jgi:cobalt-zinc-cadmium efflux system membrane fusion protein
MSKTGIVFMVLMAWVYGCHPDKGSQHQADAHQDDEVSSQFTLFSENTEFFIEHTPLEAGKESAFLVHLTDLATYKPYRSGNVTIMIDGVSVTSDQPLRPGIFEILFVPEKAGAFHATITYQTESISESVEGQVHVLRDHEDLLGQESGESGHSHGAVTEGEITFLKEQAWKSDFYVSEVNPVPFASVIPTSGEILAMPGEKKSVSANGRGVVHFTDRTLVQGSPVVKGQHLFTLGSKTLLENNVELQYQESKNRYEKSKSEYERHQKLYARGAISERQFITSRSDFRADSLQFHTLSANVSTEGLKVYAPQSGTIHELNVSEGQYTETGQIMVVISSNKTLLIRADLSQQFYDQLKEIESANFRTTYSDEVYSIEDVDGKLLAAGTSVAENDHYLPIIFQVENDGSLLEGAFVEIFLKTTQKKDCLVVPQTAISEEQGEYYVYVQVAGESYTKRAVSPGENDGQSVEILMGLHQGERVVTRGVMLVKAASMVTGAGDHGHSH